MHKSNQWPFTTSKHLTTPIWDHLEKELCSVLNIINREANKWADLVTWDGTIKVEVKARYFTQPVEISLKQITRMTEELIDSEQSHYYAISFYKTVTGDRVAKLLDDNPLWLTRDDIEKEIILETILLFPLPIVLLFLAWLTTSIKQWDKRSSNMWPIKKFYNQYNWTKEIFTSRWQNDNTISISVIWEEMINWINNETNLTIQKI